MLVYIFEPHDIDWDQQVIKGTTMNGEGLFPFPAVIYDRFFLGGEKKIDIDQVRAMLQSVYHIPFVNSMTLFYLTGNKWDCHQLLSREHEEVLPETRLLQNSSDIAEMLDRYGEIFLKPVGGALSMGVIRVIRRPTGIFCMDTKQKSFQQMSGIDELFAIVSPLMKEFISRSGRNKEETVQRKKFRDTRLYAKKWAAKMVQNRNGNPAHK